MLNSLYSRLAAGLSGLFFGVGLLFVGITVFSTDMYQKEVNQKLNNRLAEQIVSQKNLMLDGHINDDAMKDIFHMLMVINPGIEIYLLDPEGRILTFSAPPGSVKRTRIDLSPVKAWLERTSPHLILGDDPRSTLRKKAFSAARIPASGLLEGYLYVILGGEQYDSVVQKLKGSYILQLSFWMILAGLVFALVAGLIIFALMTGRLTKLASVVGAFEPGRPPEPGDFTALSQRGTSDEIDRLIITFKDMALRIQTQMAELKQSDDLRRELIANVSHDLRTPLATLQGYIETLLMKDNQYSPETRREYLEIAIRHCRRLNRLVRELLELARLDSAAIPMTVEPFNLSELAQDVAQKFQLQAREKQITIITDPGGDIPFVIGDIALIERVLENLIENAVHYTPSGGTVNIELQRTDGVQVLVRDTGPGIPEQELAHLFNRFYPVDSGRQDSSGHVGLGLAIARRILELHNGTIQVQSRLGLGSVFFFSLPVQDGQSAELS
ncbi:MAG: ATP-binding protein [Pseudomonadota bacterium]